MSNWLFKLDVITAIISGFGYFWVKFCRKHWNIFILPSIISGGFK